MKDFPESYWDNHEYEDEDKYYLGDDLDDKYYFSKKSQRDYFANKKLLDEDN